MSDDAEIKQTARDRAMFANMGSSGGGGGGASGGGKPTGGQGGLWKRGPDGKRTPQAGFQTPPKGGNAKPTASTAQGSGDKTKADARLARVPKEKRDALIKRHGDEAEAVTRQRFVVQENTIAGNHQLVDNNRQTSSYRGVTVATGTRAQVERNLESRVRTARTRAETSIRDSINFMDSDAARGMYESIEGFTRDLARLEARPVAVVAARKSMDIDDAIKAGRRHSASDNAVMKAMHAEMKAYKGYMGEFAMKMSDYLKALGVEDEDGDGEVTMDDAEAMDDMPEMKALDLITLNAMVGNAVREALDELDLLEEDEDDEEAQALTQMSGPVMADYRKGEGYEADEEYPYIYVYATSATAGYAVACLGAGIDWHIPYTMEAAEVVLATPDTWKRVGMEWKPIPGAEPVMGGEVKMMDDGETIIAPAIAYGSADAADMSAFADYFTKSTDFWLGQWDRRPMLYHHAMDEGTRDAPVIGAWTKAWSDDAGVWLEGQLDKAHKYHAAIKELARRGLLRISTDSAPHLVQRQRQPNGTHEVKRWPILAASLTITPAEPRLLPVELKSILEDAGLIESDHAKTKIAVSEDHEQARALQARLRLLKVKTQQAHFGNLMTGGAKSNEVG